MPLLSPPDPLAEHTRQQVNLQWLIRLRWSAVAGQMVVIAVVTLGLGIRLPWGYLLFLVGCIALTNAVLHQVAQRMATDRADVVGKRQHTTLIMASVVAFDVLLLTALLYGTGGRDNPFAVFYLVHVVLGAVLLPARSAWLVAALCLIGYGAVFVAHVPVPELVPRGAFGGGRLQHGVSLHAYGMFVALAAAAAVLVYFVTRLSSALREQERRLDALRQREALARHAHALAAFAAGAAHELGSPLTSIAITARELERGAASGADPEMADDARIIRQEVERCRAVLARIATDAGTRLGEEPAQIAVAPWLEEVLADPGFGTRVRSDITSAAAEATLHAPPIALMDAVRSVLRNALQAGGTDSVVDLRVHLQEDSLVLEVVDRGHGMSPDILRRADEPFFSTRGGGDGLGLGLYLTRALVHDLGGHFTLQSREGIGTTARIALPLTRPPAGPTASVGTSGTARPAERP